MKFLKEKKGIIILFIIVAILASSITVYATGYLASQITYKNDKTVEEALNDLYSKISNDTKEITTNGEQSLDKYYKNLNVTVPTASSIVSLATGDKVSSISCSIGDLFILQTVFGGGANIDGLSGCEVIASCLGPSAGGIDSRGLLVRATTTTISATNQFGYIKLGTQ